MKRLVTVLALVLAFTSQAQGPSVKPTDPYQLYMQVLRGQRSFESLTPAEKQQLMAVQSLMARSCNQSSPQCQKACEAANALQDAADELARCAKRHDLTDDCRRKYKDTKYAYEEYESAVADIDDDCS